MHKKFAPILDKPPIIFSEDIYLITNWGDVFAKREYIDRKIDNIFTVLKRSEIEFIREKTRAYIDKPYLLVISKLGPIFVDCSLYASFGIFAVIVPFFEQEETYSLTKSKLLQMVTPSDKVKLLMEISLEADLNAYHDEFAKRLINAHSRDCDYEAFAYSNVEIAVMMSDIAYSLSELYGCDLEVNIENITLYDCNNAFCMYSYVFALSCFLLLARECSADRSACISITFDRLGGCVELEFEIESCRTYAELTKLQSLKSFLDIADFRLFDCYTFHDGNTFTLRAYPWKKLPDSPDLKEDKEEKR